jgi:uncharacterized protein YfaS (alpha-2-macroglobulin family)
MIDPKENINRRWLSRQSNFGAVSLNYTLSDQPMYGNWTIRVQALNQIEEKKFWVEEYYQPRFEVSHQLPTSTSVDVISLSDSIRVIRRTHPPSNRVIQVRLFVTAWS